MATVTKTWTFDSNTDGWTGSGLAWTSADSGSIAGGETGRNNGAVGNKTLSLSTTYSALGVPSGASITSIVPSVKHKCTAYTTANYLYWDFRIDTTVRIAEETYTETTSWATKTGSSFETNKVPADTIALQLYGSARTAASTSASVQFAFDDISLVITYTPASENKSANPSSSIGFQTTTAFTKEVSTTLSSSIGFQTTVEGAKQVEGWYNANWQNRIKITVDKDLVYENLDNFPIYFNLGSLPSSFHNAVKSDGSDIRITKGDATTELPREIVYYDDGEGELYFKGDLSTSENTDFYIYYNNESAEDYSASATYGRNNVWTSDYKGVWHFNEASGTVYDSTSNATNTTSETITARASAGKLGKTIDISGSSDVLEFGDVLDLGTNDMTISYWIKTTQAPSTYGFVLSKSKAASQNYRYACGIKTVSGTTRANIFYQGDGGSDVDIVGGTAVNNDAWRLLTFVFDRSGNAIIYVDGEYETQSAISQWDNKDFQSNNPFRIGGYTASDNTALTLPYNGLLDEVRLAWAVKSANWIKSEYANQNNPSTFFAIGSQETQSASDDKSTDLSSSIGFQTTTAFSKEVSKTLSSSVGFQTTTAFNKEVSTTLSSSIGFNTLLETVKNEDLILHLDASQLDLSNDDKVSTWEDISGRENDLSQATNDYQPTFKIIDGKKCVRFDGTDDFLTANVFSTATASMTAIVLMRTNDRDLKRQPIFYNGNGANSGYGLIINREATTDDAVLGLLRVLYGGVAWHSTGTRLATDDWYIVVLTVRANGTPLVHLNGTEIYSGSGSAPNTPAGSFSLGHDNQTVTATRNFKGDIAEMFLYKKILSDSQREEIEQYLTDKWISDDKTANLSSSIGFQTTTAFTKATSTTVSGTIGFQQTTAFSKGVAIELADSIGFNITLDFEKVELEQKSANITSSIGFQTYLEFIKTGLSPPLTSSIGEQITLELSKEVEKALTDSIGVQHSLTGTKEPSISVSDSIGFNETTAFTKDVAIDIENSIGFNVTLETASDYNITTSLSSSIGFQETLEFTKDVSTTLTDSIGVQETLTLSKSIEKEFSSSVGFNESLETTKGIGVNIENSLGLQALLETTKNAQAIITDSLGVQETIETTKQVAIDISDSIGFNVTLIGTSEETEEKNVNISDSIGFNVELIGTKETAININEQLGLQTLLEKQKSVEIDIADSIGFNVNLETSVSEYEEKSVNLSSSIGFNETIQFNKNINLDLSTNLGINELIEFSKSVSKGFISSLGINELTQFEKHALIDLFDSIGFNVKIVAFQGDPFKAENLQQLIGNYDKFIRKTATKEVVYYLVGERKKINLIGRKGGRRWSFIKEKQSILKLK
jgi:hypothetical protein